jgi:5'-deoxynucleotidase YfbR-like HD superfamily hydrolase
MPALSPKPRTSPLLEAVLRHAGAVEVQIAPPEDEIRADIDAMFEGFSLQRIRRFFRQIHWSDESTAAEFSDKVEPGLKLENVAAHSWHVADVAHLLAGHFSELSASRVVLLAILHDKLEIYTGDLDPVGSDGKGTKTHAFDAVARVGKQDLERAAATQYLSKLRPGARQLQEPLIAEIIEGSSPEARFVKAIDKLQALAFVLEKKGGSLSDEHLLFTLKYSRRALLEFPKIRFHYAALLNRVLDTVAKHRSIPRTEFDKHIFGQLELPL